MAHTLQLPSHLREKPVQLRRPGHRPSGLPSGSESCMCRNVHGIRMSQELHRPELLPAKTPQLPEEPAQFSQEKRTITPSIPHVPIGHLPVNHGLTVAARMRFWQLSRLDTTPSPQRAAAWCHPAALQAPQLGMPTKEQTVLSYRWGNWEQKDGSRLLMGHDSLMAKFTSRSGVFHTWDIDKRGHLCFLMCKKE